MIPVLVILCCALLWDVHADLNACEAPNIEWIGNGYCDSTVYNNEDCDWDGGDCCETTCENTDYDCGIVGFNCFNPDATDYEPIDLPEGCDPANAHWVADGWCDGPDYNNVDCEWDGGDCCDSTCEVTVYDCTVTMFCLDPSAEEYNDDLVNCNAATLSWIGDGFCDYDEEYNNAECNWDGGDCCSSTCENSTFTCGVVGFYCWDPQAEDFQNTTLPGGCHAPNAHYVGDGSCNFGLDYNTERCDWDGGDCCASTCEVSVFDCTSAMFCVDPEAEDYNEDLAECGAPIIGWIGDGNCDANGDYNSADCGWDGGDCCYSTCQESDLYDCTADFDCLDPNARENTDYTSTASTSPPTFPTTDESDRTTTTSTSTTRPSGPPTNTSTPPTGSPSTSTSTWTSTPTFPTMTTTTTTSTSTPEVIIVAGVSLDGETVESFDESKQEAFAEAFQIALENTGVVAQVSIKSINGVDVSNRRLLDSSLAVELNIVMDNNMASSDITSIEDTLEDDSFASDVTTNLEEAGVEMSFIVESVVVTSTTTSTSTSTTMSNTSPPTGTSPTDLSTTTSSTSSSAFHSSVILSVDSSSGLDDDPMLDTYIEDLAIILGVDSSSLEVVSVNELDDGSYEVVVEFYGSTEEEVIVLADAFASLTPEEMEAAQIGAVESGCSIWSSCGSCAGEVTCSWCDSSSECIASDDVNHLLCPWLSSELLCSGCAADCVSSFLQTATCELDASCSRAMSTTGTILLGGVAFVASLSLFLCCKKAKRRLWASSSKGVSSQSKPARQTERYAVAMNEISESRSEVSVSSCYDGNLINMGGSSDIWEREDSVSSVSLDGGGSQLSDFESTNSANAVRFAD